MVAVFKHTEQTMASVFSFKKGTSCKLKNLEALK